MKPCFPCSEQREIRMSWTVQELWVLGLWSGEPGWGLASPVLQLAQQCSHTQGNMDPASSPSHNGYKYDSWNLPNNRQEQYSQQAGGEQLSMKETPAEVGIHCFLLMFITVPKSGKNRLLAFRNNFLPSLYCLEESVLLKHSCFGDRENYLSAWVKFHLRLLSRLSR